jgi:hypothetical protein
MGILLAFLPFVVFVVMERLVGVTAGLGSAAIVAAGLLARDAVSRNRSMKVLEIGTVILFGGLAAYAWIAGAAWSIAGVRLRVDGGLLIVVLVSMMIRRPFTLQYAREQVSRELWDSPRFIHTNYVITAVWAAAFALMVVADLAMLYVPTLPTRVAIIVTILALYGAARFTAWYPERGQAKQAALRP